MLEEARNSPFLFIALVQKESTGNHLKQRNSKTTESIDDRLYNSQPKRHRQIFLILHLADIEALVNSMVECDRDNGNGSCNIKPIDPFNPCDLYITPPDSK